MFFKVKKTFFRFLLGIFIFLPIVNNVYGQEISVLRNSANWMYSESKPGLRQQGEAIPILGELFYKRERLPEQVSREGVYITTDIGTFRYSEREDQMSSGGWLFSREEKSGEAIGTDKKIEDNELKAGFYEDSFKEKKKGTPAHWVFVEINGNKESLYWTKDHFMFWVDPEILSKFGYLLNRKYCHSDSDCMCVSGSGVPFLGCENNLYAPQAFGGAYDCKNCACVNKVCTPKENNPMYFEKRTK